MDIYIKDFYLLKDGVYDLRTESNINNKLHQDQVQQNASHYDGQEFNFNKKYIESIFQANVIDQNLRAKLIWIIGINC